MVKLFLTDVDGCLTDGGMYYGDDGAEYKRFCVYDGMGVMLLQQAGVPCGILTSERVQLVVRRARKLNLAYLYLGTGSKANNDSCIRYSPAKAEPQEIPFRTKREAAEDICRELGITMAEVCFVGDDVNDIDLLQAVGYPMCPPNSMPEVLALKGIHVLKTAGGQGAIREATRLALATLNK
ncbi:MAG: HAD family hydrolase [Paludibacteraceae bacterium]|jgi:Low specificity phosphatase (HAD superfamily)|nr:HAD family hydrolase [Paludibacteraceae bacterium]